MSLAFPKPEPREKRRKPLRAKRWGLRNRHDPKRAGTDRDDPAFKAFVRTLGCCCAGMPNATPCGGPIEASHVSLSPNQKGTGLKVHDRQCVPHCHRHHREYDGREGRRGMFEGWTRAEKWEQAALWVAATQLLATPEDRDGALALQEMGLGRIVDGEGGRWTWEEGPDRDEAAA